MSRFKAIVLTLSCIAVMTFAGETNKPAMFWSLKHPEWPPSPVPASLSLPMAPLGDNNYLVDDRKFVYPTNAPEPAQAVVPPKKFEMQFNTNYAAAHPEIFDWAKKQWAHAYDTNKPGISESDKLLMSKRLEEINQAIDGAKNAVTTNSVNATNR